MMQKWTGENYIGKRYNDYYICYTQNRDSGVLDQSNFRSIKKYLESKKAVFEIVSFNHWAVGWIEQILIQENQTESVKLGNEISEKLEGYPVFDDFDFSDLEWEKAEELLEEINKDISNLDTDEELKGWHGITKDMSSEKILDTIMNSGMVPL